MNENICGYCGSRDSKNLYPTSDIFGNKYEIHKCHNCAAYFLAPRPDENRLNQAYDSSYYGTQEEKFSSSRVEQVLDYFRKQRAKNLGKYLKEDDHVLDVGCGNGRFLSYLLKYGKFHLHGTELDGNSAKRASRIPELQLKTGILEKGDFEKESLSAITMFHVFEHLQNPIQMLDIIDEILKKDGILIMSFPNIASLQSELFKGKWLHLDPPRHLFFFPPRDFKKMMKKRGYEILKETHLSTEQNPFGFSQSILNLFYKKREILFESMKGNSEYIKEFSKTNLLLQKGFFAASFPFFVLTDFFESFFKRGASVCFVLRKNGRK